MAFAKLFGALVLAVCLSVWAAPAYAQDASITVEPPTVETEGPVDLTVVGAGFPAGDTVFVFACPGAEGDPTMVSSDNATSLCDIAGLQQPTADDSGGFTADITSDVPASGLVILASTQDSSVRADHVVTVGAADEPAPTAPPEESPQPTPEPEPELARTGGESGMMAIIGVSIVIGGLLLVGMSKRLSRI